MIHYKVIYKGTQKQQFCLCARFASFNRFQRRIQNPFKHLRWNVFSKNKKKHTKRKVKQGNATTLVRKQTLSDLDKLVCIHTKRVYDIIKTHNQSTKKNLQHGYS